MCKNTIDVYPVPKFTHPNDATYVYNQYKSLVGVGNTPLNLTRLKPEFRGFVIFVNGYMPAPWDNMGSTLWNATMDRSPEKGEGFNGGRNANMEDHTDPRDRYKERANNEDELEYTKEAANDESLEGSDYHDENKEHAWINVFSSKDNKQHSMWEYWNQKENNFRFSLVYSQYFRSRGNVYYINGSHGLGSCPKFRMSSGYEQGYAWAKENFYLPEKKDYDKYIKNYPFLLSPEYIPVTLVLHSQGNAKGIGVAKGIMQYVKDIGWDKIALNIVMLSVHQNLQLTGGTYTSFKKKKEDMLASSWWQNYLSSLYGKDKLKMDVGIDEHAKEFITLSSWGELKKRAVQFTFANDRGDLVMRMGDIPEIANACHSDNIDLFPFEVDDLGNITYSKGRIFEYYEGSKDKGSYTKLVEKYAKAYSSYQSQKKYFELYPHERYDYFPRGGRIDYLQGYYNTLYYAYGKLAGAEIDAHGAPIKWGLKDDGSIVSEPNANIFKLIQKKGDPFFYRNTIHTSRILKI